MLAASLRDSKCLIAVTMTYDARRASNPLLVRRRLKALAILCTSEAYNPAMRMVNSN